MLYDFYVYMIKMSEPNSWLRERYAKGIIKVESGGVYREGEMKKIDDVYNFLLSFNFLMRSDEYKIKEKIKEIK